ncbi:hypothetical protein ACJIZ3_011165 [Penstemon smallii]|uniref:Uncharacterized protein n=1 Tax=Penstemon smallii TaxID=265156 RepID=A0ABD3ULI8_9LAMI
MAKAIALVSALCILALATLAQGHPTNLAEGHLSNVFNVTGKVYCDPCRVQFQNQFSRNVPGATVKLSCSNIDTKVLTYSVEGVTDNTGYYNLLVTGDHENDICEVVVVKSPEPDCSEKMSEVESSRIEITENSGMHSDVRFANPIGLMTKDTLPECVAVENFDKDDD